MDKCLQQEINEFFVPTFDTMNVFFECILQGEVKHTKKHATYSGANVLLLAGVTIPLHHPDFILTIITTQFMHVSIAVIIIIIIIILVAVPAHAAGTLTVEEAEVSAAGSSQELRQLSRLGPYRQRKETGMN